MKKGDLHDNKTEGKPSINTDWIISLRKYEKHLLIMMINIGYPDYHGIIIKNIRYISLILKGITIHGILHLKQTH